MIKHNLSIPVLNHLKNDLHKQYIRIQRIHPGAHNFFSEYLDFSSFLPPYQKKNREFFFFFLLLQIKNKFTQTLLDSTRNGLLQLVQNSTWVLAQAQISTNGGSRINKAIKKIANHSQQRLNFT